MLRIKIQDLPMEKYQKDFMHFLSLSITPKLKSQIEVSLGYLYKGVKVKGKYPNLEINISRFFERPTHVDEIIERKNIAETVKRAIGLNYSHAFNQAWTITEILHADLKRVLK